MNQELENVGKEPMEEVEVVQVAEFSEEEHELAVVEELPDYSHLNKEDLLKTALAAASQKELDEAIAIFKTIRPFIEQQISEEKAIALEKYIEEGGEKDNFEFKGDQTKELFNKAFQELKLKKEDARRRQDEEKKGSHLRGN
jgi:hypothetical protein